MGKPSASPPPPSIPSADPTPAPPTGEDVGAYEAAHVHSVYDCIAPHFSATRYAPWPRVDAFLAGLAPGSLVADVGCGNGKYLSVGGACPNDLFLIGGDRCAPLASIAARASPARSDVIVADAMSQPFRTGTFDAVVNIAVVHHFATRPRRIAAWNETVRLLRPGGRALLYVWALERPEKPEPRRGRAGKRMLARLFDEQDMLVPWHMRRRKKGADDDRILGDTEEVLMRYYHVYADGELEGELKQVEGAKVVEIGYDHQNWCAVVERVEV